ncbi:hypothetical protein [Wenyingzhuangia sp. 2_MG-2023]|uniref:hypothetical protein n=1 Tax=Wenyingzhuangia sp. 2_MG-2023 TaxID=3062639 RepID=UPI0026E39083|nr:hypothetical protein [Wenyingzhuangia sp. 2_MG-2023]MDO6739453.1 hypothetical protein [Wenyingzhuangia sp. 2_MG-2023]
MKKNDFHKEQERIKPIIILWVKRIYVISFNIYAWFWLIREIFFRKTTEFEPYLLWFFTTVGMYYFVLENQDVFIKTKND